MDEKPLLQVEDLSVSFSTEERLVRAVNGVNLSVYPRQTLAVVGESGCGKSVTALSALQLIPQPPGSYDSGRIMYDNRSVLELNPKQMQQVRGGEIAMIFQEPMTSLNPVYTVGNQILEAIDLHQHVSRQEALAIAEQALRDVGIGEPRRRLREYPHQMSGGMRQRVMIAMALACRPRLLLADEPTTALDVTIQAQILELLRKLQLEHDMSIMLITHDLGVVAENADVVAVMYAGRVVEYGSVVDVFDHPRHPYTRGLFRSLPRLSDTRQRLQTIQGQVPDPAGLPPGCPFHPRCDRTREVAASAPEDQTTPLDAVGGEGDGQARPGMRQCVAQDPALLEVAPHHWVACWYAEGYEAGKQTRPDLAYRKSEAKTFA